MLIKNKCLKFLPLLTFFLLISCSQDFKEVQIQSNESNIKIKLELEVKKSEGTKDVFTIRLSNPGERDLGRCTLKFNNKYEHQLEGLINKDEDWEGYLQHSMLKTGESVTLFFGPDSKNYVLLGIPDSESRLPETIEVNCLDGKVIWKIK